ncbi:MAG: Gfo/Idh/MocA family oxidoreductase [Clostridiales bacterium]|nr:Gfo/Idh/MocA family oxidoreductase [Clostridiales bacterium]
MKTKRIIRVGVVGGGAIAQHRHLPEYAANPNAEIAGILDFNRARMEDLCEQYDAKVYADYDEMLADPSIDAISVCTPNFTHAETTIKALEAGKHALCEKPMALSLTETRAMLKAAERSGKVLMIGHNQRLIKAHLKARDLIQDGAIGKLLFYQCNFKHAGPEVWSVDKGAGTWFFRKDKANFGVMGDLGAHKIDLIRFLTGDEIKDVFATMMTLDKRYEDGSLIELEDNAVCQFHMVSGLPGIMHFSWTNYGDEDNSTIIYGDKGVMKIFGDYSDDIVLEMRDGSHVKYSVGAIATNTNQTKSGVIDEFISAILEDRTPIVTGRDGHNTLAVIEMAMESARQGKWMDIVY